MLLIYSENITSRLEYVTKYIFKEVIHADYEFTTDKTYFQSFRGPRINYSTKSYEGNSIQITPVGLCHENDIHTHLQPGKIETGSWNGNPVLFKTNVGTITFDLFSAVFYLISRYEEYIVKDRDQHGRFQAKNSILHRINAIQKPVVNIWIENLCKLLKQYYPNFDYTKPSYKFNLTVDIDHITAYRGKKIKTRIGRYLLDLFNIPVKFWLSRFFHLLNSKNDPYDTFDIFLSKKQLTNELIFFLLLSNNKSKFDKNLNFKNEEFKYLLKRIKDYSKTGIHPSYNSNIDPKELEAEFNNFNALLKHKPRLSRQHYLKLSLPETYQNLVKLGIQQDYSMGFSEAIGFRAGTCTPFNFFDLTTDQETNLRIYPTYIMDVTLKEQFNNDFEEILMNSKQVIDLVRQYHGVFILLWHNSSFCRYYGWSGWNNIFDEIVQMAAGKDSSTSL